MEVVLDNVDNESKRKGCARKMAKKLLYFQESIAHMGLMICSKVITGLRKVIWGSL